MYAELSLYAKIVSLTLSSVLFLTTGYKASRGVNTKQTWYFLVIVLLLGIRVVFLSLPYISFLLIIALIYFTGKFHYRVKRSQEELIWRISNITIFLFALLPGFAGLVKHHFFYLFEISLSVFYACFQLLFLRKKLKIQYGALRILPWCGIMVYAGLSACDFIALAFGSGHTNLVVWITIGINLYLGSLVIFKAQFLFPGTAEKRENIYHTYARLADTEELLILQDKLVKVGALATGIIHELKNIFFTINSSVDLALNRQDPEIRNQCLLIIRECAEKGKLFTETVLKRIKLEEQKKEKLALAAEFQKLLAIVKTNYRSEGVVFSCQAAGELFIFAGKIDFEQIVLNLISNSVNALDKSGKEEKTIHLSASQVNDKIVIDIIDNGPGVPQALESVIFQPDVSGNTSTGLGLYIADLLVKRNNGVLAYYPLDPGADFRMIFEKPDP